MLKQSEIYAIDGEALYNTSSVSVSMEDLEVSAERDANGYLHRERARQGVRKVSFTYEVMTQEELSETLKKLKPEYFHLTYLDPERGVTTIECYCSKKDSELYSAVYYNGLWRNVKFNCVER